MRTMRWGNVDGTLLIVYARVQPAEREFARFIADASQMGTSVRRVLVFSDVALTAEQRGQVTGLRHGPKPVRVALITRTTLTRMIMTALNWTQRTRRAFEPSELEAAFAYLQIEQPHRTALLERALRYARDLDHTELATLLDSAASPGPPAGTAVPVG